MSIQPLSLSGTLDEITQSLTHAEDSDVENGLNIEVEKEKKFKTKQLESFFLQSNRAKGFVNVSFNGLEMNDKKFNKVIDVMGHTLSSSARLDVNFSNNHITDKGAEFFANHMDTLRRKQLIVYLMSNQIGPHGLQKILNKVENVYDIAVQVTNDKQPSQYSKFEVKRCPIAEKVNEIAERNRLHHYLLEQAKSFKNRVQNGENLHTVWEALNQDKEGVVRRCVIQEYRAPLSRASSVSADEFQKQLKEVEKAEEARIAEALSHQQNGYLEDWSRELDAYMRYDALLGEPNETRVQEEIRMIKDYIEAANPKHASAQASRSQSVADLTQTGVSTPGGVSAQGSAWQSMTDLRNQESVVGGAETDRRQSPADLAVDYAKLERERALVNPLKPDVVGHPSLIDMNIGELAESLEKMDAFSKGLEEIERKEKDVESRSRRESMHSRESEQSFGARLKETIEGANWNSHAEERAQETEKKVTAQPLKRTERPQGL